MIVWSHFLPESLARCWVCGCAGEAVESAPLPNGANDSGFLHQQQFRRQLDAALSHTFTSPNAYTPADIALGFLGRIPTSSRARRGGRAIRQWPRCWASKQCRASPP